MERSTPEPPTPVHLPRRETDENRIPAKEATDETTESQSTVTASPAPTTAPTGPRLAYSRTLHRSELRETSDTELLWAIRDDDEAALDELIQRKTQPLLQLAYRILGDAEEARDIVQLTLFRLWEHRERFDERWSPNTWIYRIATNLAIDHLRSRQSRQRNSEPMRLHLQGTADSQTRRDLAQLYEGEVMSIFHELAAELTDKQRAVFLLRELEGLASKEVAEIVGCRESTVRNHLFNARKILRRGLLERYPEYARHYTPEDES